MATAYQFADTRLSKLDGFEVEIDEAHERADHSQPPCQPLMAMPGGRRKGAMPTYGSGEKHRASVPRLFRWISTHSSTIDEPHGDFDRRFSRKGFSATSPDEIVFLAIRKGLDLSVIRTGDLCTPASRFGFERLD
jgi:hypothetical protein